MKPHPLDELFADGKFDNLSMLNKLAAKQPPPADEIPIIEEMYGVKWDAMTARFIKK